MTTKTTLQGKAFRGASSNVLRVPTGRQNRETLMVLAWSNRNYTARELQRCLWNQTRSLNLGNGETVKEFLDRQVSRGVLQYNPISQRYNP